MADATARNFPIHFPVSFVLAEQKPDKKFRFRIAIIGLSAAKKGGLTEFSNGERIESAMKQ